MLFTTYLKILIKKCIRVGYFGKIAASALVLSGNNNVLFAIITYEAQF